MTGKEYVAGVASALALLGAAALLYTAGLGVVVLVVAVLCAALASAVISWFAFVALFDFFMWLQDTD